MSGAPTPAGWKAALRQRTFITHWSGALVFPSHILRSGLCREISALARRVSGKTLDFGCGSKPYETLFSHCDEYIGIDIEQSGHDHAASKVDHFYDGATIPFGDAHFDSAVSFEVFEHVPDLNRSLREIARVLSPGAALLFSMPFAFGEHEVPHDYRRLTSFAIEKILREEGFEMIELRRTTTNFLTAAQLGIDAIIDSRQLGTWWKIVRIPLVAAMNIAAIVGNWLVPSRHDLPLDFVVLARRV